MTPFTAIKLPCLAKKYVSFDCIVLTYLHNETTQKNIEIYAEWAY